MDPVSFPPELSDLTECEEMLIAGTFQITQGYVRKGYNTISYKRLKAKLPHKVQNVANIHNVQKSSCKVSCESLYVIRQKT